MTKLILYCKFDYFSPQLMIEFKRGDLITLYDFKPLEDEEGKVVLHTGKYLNSINMLEDIFIEDRIILEYFCMRKEYKKCTKNLKHL